MPVTDDLMLAILAMDSYNRGYSAGLEDPNATGGGLGVSTASQDYFIGTAKITDSKGDAEALAAGFYAVAYDWTDSQGNDQTVISYRGTDSPLDDGDEGGDLLDGWISGAGLPAGQSELAFEFYEAVTGVDAFEGQAQGVTLTGHSLGGGLHSVSIHSEFFQVMPLVQMLQ